MKKIMKSFMAMALGLSLVLSGCSKDDDDEISFAGTYTADVTVSGIPGIPGGTLPISDIALTLSKDGANYVASAELATYGSLSLILSQVTEKVNEGGLAMYTFKVDRQTLNITSVGEIGVTGNGTLNRGSEDGKAINTIYVGLKGDGDIDVSISGTK
jgi:hypothetical protein